MGLHVGLRGPFESSPGAEPTTPRYTGRRFAADGTRAEGARANGFGILFRPAFITRKLRHIARLYIKADFQTREKVVK